MSSRGGGGREIWRALSAPIRRGPLLTIVRWWREILLIVGLLILQDVLSRSFGSAVAIGAVLAAVAVASAVPAVRRAAGRFAMTLVVAHRLRAALRAVGLVSFSGRPPAVLRTSSRRVGIVATVWLPAGVTAGDIQDASPVIAAACFGAAAYVDRHPHRANVVYVTVTADRYRFGPEPWRLFERSWKGGDRSGPGSAEAGSAVYSREIVDHRRMQDTRDGFLSGLASTFAPFGDHRWGIAEDTRNIALDFERARAGMASRRRGS